MLPLRQINPKNARTKRYLDRKAPQPTESPRTTLFLRYTTCSPVLQLVLADLYALKRPSAVKFSKKNNIHPFEDASSLEFFSDKNDASLMLYASHSKKRPHCLTLARFFDFRVLDMIELLVDPDSVRTLSQFKNAKPAVGLKPLLAFSGTAWDSPTPNAYTLAKSLFLDFFKGPDVKEIDVEGLRYMIHLSVPESTSSLPNPPMYLRTYLLRTLKSGGPTPRVEVEEMGPRIDFRVGRTREADPVIWKEAMRRHKGPEARPRKNVGMDLIGDKVGRVHVGRQDLGKLQTRKMKGLKRSRDDVGDAMNGDRLEGSDLDGGMENGKRIRRDA